MKIYHKSFLEISPCAHHVIFVTEFELLIKTPPFYEVNSFKIENSLRVEEFQKYFFYTTFHHHFLGQKCKNFTHIPFWPGKQWSDLSYTVQIGLLFTIIFNIMSIPESHPTFVQTQELSIEVFHWKHQCFSRECFLLIEFWCNEIFVSGF